MAYRIKGLAVAREIPQSMGDIPQGRQMPFNAAGVNVLTVVVSRKGRPFVSAGADAKSLTLTANPLTQDFEV